MSVGSRAVLYVEERKHHALPPGYRWEGREGTYMHPQNSIVGRTLYALVDGEWKQVELDFGVRKLHRGQVFALLKLVWGDDEVGLTEGGLRDGVKEYTDG